MRTIALTVAYDGTDWFGFQRQREFATIQGSLEDALSKVFQHPVELVCGGRTDTGVHAIAQVVSFKTPSPIPIDRVCWVTNRFLPASIRIRNAREASERFHARFSASYRRYWYVIQSTERPDPIFGRFRWQLNRTFDVSVMNMALMPLLGRHDFAALNHQEAPSGSTIRTLKRATVFRWKHGVIVDIQADAFLHQMVRLLVANLVLVGSGDKSVTWLEELLHSCNRHMAGKGASPCGLFLMRIGYPPTVNPR